MEGEIKARYSFWKLNHNDICSTHRHYQLYSYLDPTSYHDTPCQSTRFVLLRYEFNFINPYQNLKRIQIWVLIKIWKAYNNNVIVVSRLSGNKYSKRRIYCDYFVGSGCSQSYIRIWDTRKIEEWRSKSLLDSISMC